MSAENNSDIKLCQNMSIENMWDIFYVGRKCLKICRRICQTYYVLTTLPTFNSLSVNHDNILSYIHFSSRLLVG